MTAASSEGTPDAMVFGPAEKDDLDALVSIDHGTPRAWTREAFAAELSRVPPTLFVLRSSGGPVAFVVARFQIPDMDIVNLAVSPDRRGRGIGRRLLSSLLGQAASFGVQSVFLEVREGNEEARRLYQRAGFRETQRRRDFYREPVEDAILMRLQMSHKQG